MGCLVFSVETRYENSISRDTIFLVIDRFAVKSHIPNCNHKLFFSSFTMNLLENRTFYMPKSSFTFIVDAFNQEIILFVFFQFRVANKLQKVCIIFSAYTGTDANAESICTCMTCVKLSVFATFSHKRANNNNAKICVWKTDRESHAVLFMKSVFWTFWTQNACKTDGLAAVIEINCTRSSVQANSIGFIQAMSTFSKTHIQKNCY